VEDTSPEYDDASAVDGQIVDETPESLCGSSQTVLSVAPLFALTMLQ